MGLKHLWMRRARAASLYLVVSVLAFGLAPSVVAKPVVINGAHCDFGSIVFDGRFEGGALAACQERRPGDYTLAIRPEGTPINPSPWYAFDITSTDKQQITITLDYGDYKHRYSPDIWTKEGGWRAFDGKVHLKAGGALASFRLDLAESRSVRLAGQPLIGLEDTKGWMIALSDGRDEIELAQLGSSAQGRPIYSLQTGADLPDWLLVIGRQHPPETTGAIALQSFMERLMADEPLANDFRAQFGILAVPMLNPDGVAAGNWRFESSGLDLNRDWGPFGKPESRLIRDAIAERKASGKRLIVGLDFHSTNKDVLYTQPDDDTEFGWFAGAWHQAINKRMATEEVAGPPMQRDAGHNIKLPTYKTWINVEHGAPGITVEFGDETELDRLQFIGRVAAEELMQLLLAPQ